MEIRAIRAKSPFEDEAFKKKLFRTFRATIHTFHVLGVAAGLWLAGYSIDVLSDKFAAVIIAVIVLIGMIATGHWAGMKVGDFFTGATMRRAAKRYFDEKMLVAHQRLEALGRAPSLTEYMDVMSDVLKEDEKAPAPAEEEKP